MFAELGRERVAQAYAFQEEMVKKRDIEVWTRTKDMRIDDAKRESVIMMMSMTDLLPHQKAYVREKQDIINENRRKVQGEKVSNMESMSTQEEEVDVPYTVLTNYA